MHTMDTQFSDADHLTWQQLFAKQSPLREVQIIPEFSKGISLLEMTDAAIPEIKKVNASLRQLTGWEGVYVAGFVGPSEFYNLLANKKFPIGHFIRDAKDLNYTPEPDVFHDLYGHIPFFTDQKYADFNEKFGKVACKYLNNPTAIEEFDRLYWFGLEFGMVLLQGRLKIFGAGIASSFGECAYALSGKPKLIPFDLEVIRNQAFRIDVMQDKLFVLNSYEQLYECLDKFEEKYG